MRWWKKRQSRDKYLKNNGGEPGFVAGLMSKYLPQKYKGLFKLKFSIKASASDPGTLLYGQSVTDLLSFVREQLMTRCY